MWWGKFLWMLHERIRHISRYWNSQFWRWRRILPYFSGHHMKSLFSVIWLFFCFRRQIGFYEEVISVNLTIFCYPLNSWQTSFSVYVHYVVTKRAGPCKLIITKLILKQLACSCRFNIYVFIKSFECIFVLYCKYFTKVTNKIMQA